MQTFLPFPDFEQTAKSLDSTRLSNQVNEATVILKLVFNSTLPPKLETRREFRPAKFRVPQWLPLTVLKIGDWVDSLVEERSEAWMNHPATRMWKNYRWALLCYAYSILREVEYRGIKSFQFRQNLSQFGYEVTQRQLRALEEKQNRQHQYLPLVYPKVQAFPWWLGHGLFHASHRSALLHKSPDFYGKYGWSEEPALNYYWPE